jgi:hypothetical protein
VLDAVRSAFGPAGGRPGRYDASSGALIEAIAKKQGVKPENVVLGCGSTQILRSCTHLFTAKDKPLVGTIPTYEECAGYAEMMGHPVRAVALDANFKIDLDKFAAAAKGAGLVFYCNPNNPTATYVGARATRDFLAQVAKDSPDTTSSSTRRTSTTSPIRITTPHIRSAVEKPARARRRAPSRRPTGWPASASATRSGSPRRSRRWRNGTPGPGTELAQRARHARRDRRDPARRRRLSPERQRNKDVATSR